MKKFYWWHDYFSLSLIQDLIEENWPKPFPHHKWRLYSRLKITNIYLLFKITNNYFFSTETSICSRNIFKYANIYLQWIKPFHSLNRRTQFKISSALKNLCFLKSHCLLSYKEKAISKGKSAKKSAKKCMLENERMCKHLCNTGTQTTPMVHWKLRWPFSPLLFQTQSSLWKKGLGSCTASALPPGLNSRPQWV